MTKKANRISRKASYIIEQTVLKNILKIKYDASEYNKLLDLSFTHLSVHLVIFWLKEGNGKLFEYIII